MRTSSIISSTDDLMRCRVAGRATLAIPQKTQANALRRVWIVPVKRLELVGVKRINLVSEEHDKLAQSRRSDRRYTNYP